MARGPGSRRPPFESTSVGEEAVVATEGKSRRDVLKALGAAAAGAVGGGLLSAEDAKAGHGVVNAVSSSLSTPAIHAENTEGGLVMEVTGSPGPPGIGIRVSALVTGVDVQTSEGTAIVASSEQGSGLAAGSYYSHAVTANGRYWGILGQGAEVGVSGHATDKPTRFGDPGVGVSGFAPDGVGVSGASRSGIGVSAYVYEPGATALQVAGRAKFSTAAAGTVPAGQDSASVTNPTVTALSHITVTPTGDPGQASSAPGSKPVVVWVERQPETGFVVHMSRAVRFATPFTYLIVEPAA